MKNQNIHIPDHNVFEEQSKAFLQSRKATELAKKYQASPYEEEYKPLYYLAIVGSYLCNASSIITASTWLFTYVYSIVQDTPAPIAIACTFTGIVLALLEIIQRVLGAKFFRFRLQYNNVLYGILIGMLISGSISISFSFLGGFDLVKTITTPPLYQAPALDDVATVEAKYQKMIDDAGTTAEAYFDRRKYKGRIATEDAQKYQEYLDKKIAYQDSSLIAIALTKSNNENKIRTAKAKHEVAVMNYESKTSSKGAGLGGLAIIAAFLLYLCLWYIEYYDFKTAIQYGTLVTATTSTPTTPQQSSTSSHFEAYQKALEMLQQQDKAIQEKQLKNASMPPPSQNSTPEDEVLQNRLQEPPLPIGFFTEGQRQEQLKDLYIQHIQPYIQQLQHVEIPSDKHTVEHTNFRTGELEHLDFKTVNNRLGIYLLKINNSIKQESSIALPNQLNKLLYWLQKRSEFLVK